MRPSLALALACEQIPGLLRGVAVLVPEGVVLAHLGATRVSDVEPLVRATLRCVSDRPALGNFVEYTLFSTESVLVVEVARATGRFALAAECEHGANLALVMTATRQAAAAFERELDLAPWEAV